jgi:hypothetical protein
MEPAARDAPRTTVDKLLRGERSIQVRCYPVNQADATPTWRRAEHTGARFDCSDLVSRPVGQQRSNRSPDTGVAQPRPSLHTRITPQAYTGAWGHCGKRLLRPILRSASPAALWNRPGRYPLSAHRTDRREPTLAPTPCTRYPRPCLPRPESSALDPPALLFPDPQAQPSDRQALNGAADLPLVRLVPPRLRTRIRPRSQSFAPPPHSFRCPPLSTLPLISAGFSGDFGPDLLRGGETGFPHFQQKSCCMRVSGSTFLHLFHSCGHLCG